MNVHNLELLKLQIKLHISEKFPTKGIGFTILDENSPDATEHLAWFLLNAGAKYSDIVTTSTEYGEDEDASNVQLFTHEEWQTEISRVYLPDRRYKKLQAGDRDNLSAYYWMNRQLPPSRGELKRRRQYLDRLDSFLGKAKQVNTWRPSAAIQEIRSELQTSRDADFICSNIEMLACHAAAELGDVKLLEMLLKCDSNFLEDKDYHENLALHYAAAAGQSQAVRLLIERFDQKTESLGFNNRTPLIWAARNGQLETVECLLELGAKMIARSGDPDRSFMAVHAAAKYGHSKTIDYLLTKCGNLKTAPDSDGFNVLHYAAVSGYVDLVQLLIEKFQCDINSSGFQGRTPLYLAVMAGNVEMAEFLIKKGAKMIPNETVLIQIAASFGHLKLIELLIARASDSKNARKLTEKALKIASEYGNLLLFENLKTNLSESLTQVEVYKILCPHHHRRQVTANPIGMIAFNEAAQANDLKTMELLISISDTLLPGEIDYVKVFRIAAEKGHLAIVQRLVENHGMNVDERRGDDGSRTPLMSAAAKGHVAVVEYLMTKGADICARSWNYQLERCERMAIHLAADRGHVNVIKSLLSRDADLINARDGAGDVALRYAARSGELEVLRFFIETCRQNVDTPGASNTTPLMYAAGAGQIGAVEYLLSQGADPDARTNEFYHEGAGGFTAVHFACRSGNLDVVELLLDHSPNLVNAVTDDKRCLLHWACRCNLLPLVRHLLENHQQNINLRGFKGRTPLMEAASSGSDTIVSYLLDNGADLTLRSYDEHAQMTALCFCFQDRDHLDTADVLLARGATLPLDLYNYLLLLTPEDNHQDFTMQDDHDFPEFERRPGGTYRFSMDSL